ncbi:TetR/AcrR family transcriptional regulator [Aneurinibacillus tyrosinisolvens]|uniref:TetR/AcrR family transcriptional regulator n=1 Tax=Aneurinibacillus tyrosinisolvens TaxID=1443435 RepID=UPI00063FB563|nr:TetR/AcrR family transcriptional regulator [Aneurinibacillus tyrosinisolvens]
MGRLKEFDKDAVLHKAMLVFWEKGYESTSIPDLIGSMGISRSSLYETFVDKKTLYLETIEHYKKVRQKKRELLLNAPTAKEGIKELFISHIDSAYDENFPKGCMITNAAVTVVGADSTFSQLVKDNFDNLEKMFYEVLQKGQYSGEIHKTKDIKVLSCLLLNLNHSINLLSKVKKEKQVLYDMIDTVLDLI